MSGHIDPTGDQLEALFSAGIEGPVTMLNLLRYAEVADYSASPELDPGDPISGRDAYALYSAEVLPIVDSLGGEVVVFGPCHRTVIGPTDEQWDDIALIRYPEIGAFMSMASSEDYRAIVGHRTAALADSRLVPTGAIDP